MNITIASGKGGTGKTTVAVNLAHYLNTSNYDIKVRLLDCDVEAPNDKVFLNDRSFEISKVTQKKPKWEESKCTGCGNCKVSCRYNAIAKVGTQIMIFKDLCHSCGVCQFVCPNNAFSEENYEIGKVYLSSVTNNYFFAYGELKIGETAAPSIIRAVKKYISEDAINIVDASPGTGCSVVASLDKSDIAVLVTEPTPFGLHDLKLAVQLTAEMNIPTGVIINRSDGNDNIIIDFLKRFNIPLIGQIPFNKKYAEAYSNGRILLENFSELEQIFKNIYERILKIADKKILINSDFVLDEKYRVESANYLLKEKSNYGRNINYSELMIISGKGGTGKTTISAAFSALSIDNDTVFTDCDVDAADLHLLLKPKVIEKHNFSGGTLAEIDPLKCNNCGLCAEYCRFSAVGQSLNNNFEISDIYCEGCGLCRLVCPNGAVSEKEKINGLYFVSETESGPMVHAHLGIAEENSGKLVTMVRAKAEDVVTNTLGNLIIGDGPPGIGCPVIASISGVNLVLIITEPTISGVNDMKRVLELTKHFSIDSVIIINKFDLNMKISGRIKKIAESYNSSVISEIPFDRSVNDALISGKTIIEYGKGSAYKEIVKAWKKLNKLIKKDRNNIQTER